MPREDRRVIFDRNESYQAIYTLAQKQDNMQRPMPGAITKIEEDAEDPNKINFYITNPQTDENKVAVYTRDFVAASLMMFCRGAGIPLPRKASKSVIVKNNELILRALV